MRRRTDTGKYEVRWREGGRHRSQSFTRKADAETLRLNIARARELGHEPQVDRGSQLLCEFVEEWWRVYAVPNLARNTRDSYAVIWDRHLRRRVGGLRLRDVTPERIDKLRVEL